MPFNKPVLIDLGKCPHCGNPMNASIPINSGDRPHLGAITICVLCQGPSCMIASGDGGLRLRRLTEVEEQQLARKWPFPLALAQVTADDWIQEQYGVSPDTAKRFFKWLDAIRRASGGTGKKDGWKRRNGEEKIE